MTSGDPADLDALRMDTNLSEAVLVRTLRELVHTKSVNPGIYEEDMARRVAELVQPTGAEVSFVETLPGRHSVGAILRGAQDGPRLILNGHMDTVPIDDPALWTTDPFGGEVRDGYLYGRGACDMKAGLTIQIATARYLQKHVREMRGALVLHFAVGEECAEPGTRSLLEAGFSGDYGITTEPTGLRVAVAERGLCYYRIRIKGRSIHASRAHLGRNPLDHLPAVLMAIKEYEDTIRSREHPLLPAGSCTPTVVRAGVKENAVPDYCEILLDRRLIPGETVDGEMRALAERLDLIGNSNPTFEFDLERLPLAFEPAEIPENSPFAQQVRATAELVTGRSTPIYGTPFASDVQSLIHDGGVEAVTFGPGEVEECHCADERVSLPQLREAALVTARVAADVLIEHA